MLIINKSDIEMEIKAVKGGKIIRWGFRSADQLEGAVRMEQDFCRTQLAVVVIAHGEAVGTGVMDGHHITVLGKEDAVLDHVYDVTGGLCENNDKFAVERSLPEIHIGDMVAIHDTGAHGFSMGYNYNGKLRSAEVLLHPDGSFKLIRRAETPADYFATFDGLDFRFNA